MEGCRARPKQEGRYRSGFFARYLRRFVLAKIDAQGWRQQEVAEWLGIPEHALSDYLTRRAHPSADRRCQLERLGCVGQQLLRAQILDKLESWMDANDLDADQLGNCLHQIRAYEYELEQARATTQDTSPIAAAVPGPAEPSNHPDLDSNKP